jgi:hypothetical protein
MPLSDSNKTYGDDKSFVVDIVNESGLFGSLTVGTTAIEVKVGTNRLINRKSVTLYNDSNSTLFWGYSNAVTTANGMPIFKGQFVEWSIGDNIPIFIIAGTANNNTRISEAA